MSQEMSAILESYDLREVELKNLDWADKEAHRIAENFIALEGAENWSLPGFDWPSLCRMIANSLRKHEQA